MIDGDEDETVQKVLEKRGIKGINEQVMSKEGEDNGVQRKGRRCKRGQKK